MWPAKAFYQARATKICVLSTCVFIETHLEEVKKHIVFGPLNNTKVIFGP